jgi:hypothetical protein
MNKRACSVVLLALSALIVSSRPAYAYLDPGSGSMLVQLLLGGVAGALVLVRLYWRRLMTFVGLAKDSPVGDATGESTRASNQ